MATKYTSIGLRFRGGIDPSLNKSFGRIGKQVKGLDKTLGQLKFQQKLTDDATKWRGALKRLQDAQARLGTSNQKLNRRTAEIHERYLRAERAAAKYGIRVNDLTREQKRLAKAVQATERAEARRATRARNKDTRSRLHGQALGLGGAAYGIGSQIKKAIEFETSGIRLKTVLNSDNVTRDLKIAKDHALKTTQENLWSETESLDVQYALNSAGLDAEAARAGSDVALKVAKITSGDAERVGEVMATTYNNLGDQLKGTRQEKMTRIGELLTKTQFKFQIRDFNQLGESMKEAASAMMRAHVPLEQGVTLIGALNSGGLQGSQAGTAFSATMRQMSKASKEFGFELVKTADGQADVIATLENFDQAIGGFDNANQEMQDRIQKAFGDEGVKGLAVFMKKLKELRGAQDDVANSSKGLIDKSYQDFLNSTAGQMQLLGNNARITGTVLAGTLLPGINAVLGPIVSLAQGAASLAQEYPIVGQAAGGLLTALVGLGGMIWVTRYATTLFSDGLTMARGAMAAVGRATPILGGKLRTFGGGLVTLGGKAKNLATTLGGVALKALPAVGSALKTLSMTLLTTPVGLIVAGLAVAAGLVIYYWDEVKAFLLKIWEPVAPYWEAFVGWIGGVWDGVKVKFDAFIGYITSSIDAVKGVVTDVVDFFSFGDDKKEIKVKAKVEPAPKISPKPAPSVGEKPTIVGGRRIGRTSFTYQGQGGGATIAPVPPRRNTDDVAKSIRSNVSGAMAPYSPAATGGPAVPPPPPPRVREQAPPSVTVNLEQHITINSGDTAEGVDDLIRRSTTQMRQAVTDAVTQSVHDQQRVSYGQ